MFEGKLEEYNGNLQRAAVEWRNNGEVIKCYRKLEAMLIVMDKTTICSLFQEQEK